MPVGPLPRGRPDNDTQRQRYRLQQLIQNSSTDEDLLDVWEHVTEMAKTSTDIQWASLYLAYRLGKPAPSDPSQAGGIQIDGDLSLTINSLSLEQIRAAQAAIQTLDATFQPVNRPIEAAVLPHPDQG